MWADWLHKTTLEYNWKKKNKVSLMSLCSSYFLSNLWIQFLKKNSSKLIRNLWLLEIKIKNKQIWAAIIDFVWMIWLFYWRSYFILKFWQSKFTDSDNFLQHLALPTFQTFEMHKKLINTFAQHLLRDRLHKRTAQIH